MKTIRITITCPGCQPLVYSGLFASHADAVIDALDHASSPLCGISTRVLP